MTHSIEKRRIATVRAVLGEILTLASDLDTDPRQARHTAMAQEAVDSLTRLHDSLCAELRSMEARDE